MEVVTAKFTRLLWSMDWEGSLRTLMADPSSIVRDWQVAAGDGARARAAAGAAGADGEMQKQPTAQQGQQAMQICQRYMGAAPPSPDAAMQASALLLSRRCRRLRPRRFRSSCSRRRAFRSWSAARQQRATA